MNRKLSMRGWTKEGHVVSVAQKQGHKVFGKLVEFPITLSICS